MKFFLRGCIQTLLLEWLFPALLVGETGWLHQLLSFSLQFLWDFTIAKGSFGSSAFHEPVLGRAVWEEG